MFSAQTPGKLELVAIAVNPFLIKTFSRISTRWEKKPRKMQSFFFAPKIKNLNFQYNAGLLNVLKDYGIVSPLSYLPNFYELKCFYLDDFGNLIKKEKSKRYEIKAASYRPYCVLQYIFLVVDQALSWVTKRN